MIAGELTSRVDIETATVTNPDGVVTETWAALEYCVPASVIPRSSMTFTEAAQVKATTSHLVKLRYRDDIDSNARFKIGSRVLNVDGPPRRHPEDRPETLIMECVEVEA